MFETFFRLNIKCNWISEVHCQS